MKKLSNLLILAVAVLAFASCTNENAPKKESININDVVSTRGITSVDFQGSTKTLSNADIITITKAENAQQDEDAVTSIMSSLIAAESEAQLLDVNFTMSDEPVEEGLFVFGIQTEEEKELTFQLYDEEGFNLQANNKINVTAGNNYKALNVRALSNGKYYFKLKNNDGSKELTREVVISHK